MESVIRDRQAGYYAALAAADRAGTSTVFIEFMLAALLDALREVPVAPTGQVAGHETGQVESWIPAILRSCRECPRSSREIQTLTGIKHRESFQRNYLDLLLSRNWLERTVPDKPQSRLQKYRLTNAGAAVLRQWEDDPPLP